MCGIAVIYHKQYFEPKDLAVHKIESDMARMMDQMEHRGKDSVVINNYSQCTVGFRRLAITDIDTPQPQGSNWVVYLNGEIYNYKELGYRGSECSVISQGLNCEGVDFIKKLNGMFAIVAIHDKDVYVFRDRYGIKPLYYYENKECILIASEIKAISDHPFYSFTVNVNARKQWFAFNNILTDETLFGNIYKLDKGTCWHLNENKKTKFWEWIFQPKTISFNEAVEQVRYLVQQAVSRQYPVGMPLASCLSGGVDSNILVNLAGPDYTFTAGFAGEDDERALAEQSGRKHYEIVYNQVRDFNKTIYHLEDLRVGASWSNYGLYELVSKYAKVCFDGAGSDELFGGYSWRYKESDYYKIVNRTGIKDEYCYELFKQLFPVDTQENRFLFDANYFLEGVLLVVDKLSMAHTIEMRLPFLDNDLVDFCTTLPTEFKIKKLVLKDAFRDIIPQSILAAPKRGFSSPDWFEGEGNQALKWANASYNEWEKIYSKTI
jgi:asparagine synthase (glutamine-hydrolysing)